MQKMTHSRVPGAFERDLNGHRDVDIAHGPREQYRDFTPMQQVDFEKFGRFAARDARRTWLIFLSIACFSTFLATLGAAAQQPPQAQQEGSTSKMGASTGGTHPPVKDALSRPMTAGGFVDGAPVVFADATRQAGLDKFRHRMGDPEKRTILEANGSGVALLDYDNDGWLDIYLVNGSTFDGLRGKQAPRAMLLHNNHDGTFSDVTEKAGVANERWGFGAVVGDYDNDGWPDIYVSNFGKSRLYHNNHDGTFTDVAEQAGVAVGGWSTGATWGDYDRDGLLDLFVPGYVKFDAEHPPIAGQRSIAANACQYRGETNFCGPLGLPSEGNHLFHNNGDGTFTDVTEKAGLAKKFDAYGMASVFVDVDDDGWLDLAVANDSVPSFLYRNKHDGTFSDESFLSGFAVDGEGRPHAAMGIGVGDYNRDGHVDFYVTAFSDDYNVLYQNNGDLSFADVARRAGIAETTIPFLGWGTGFIDFDNDGLLDIFVVNGHVYPSVERHDWGTTWAQRPLLFRNLDGQRFREVPAATGSGLAAVTPGRGAAFGDLFNSGRIDVVINNIDASPTLLRNVVENSNHWIALKLVGGRKSPRDAIGAKVFVTVGGVRQRADVYSGASYSSSSDPRVHFGLGSATKIERVEIFWPSGSKEEISLPAVDRFYTIVEGLGVQSDGKLSGAPSRPSLREALQPE